MATQKEKIQLVAFCTTMAMHTILNLVYEADEQSRAEKNHATHRGLLLIAMASTLVGVSLLINKEANELRNSNELNMEDAVVSSPLLNVINASTESNQSRGRPS